MNHLRWLIAFLLVAPAFADEPTTAPANESIAHGALRFQLPDGFTLIGKRQDDLSAGFSSADKSGQIVIVVAPQQQAVPDSLGPKLKQQIVDALAAEVKKGNIESLQPPTALAGKNLLVKLHDRFRSKDKVVDRMQLFRGVGKNLVSVTSNVYTEDAAIADPQHALAEQMIASVRPMTVDDVKISSQAPSTKPATKPAALGESKAFPAAAIRVSTPAEWVEQATGAATGLIASWRDPSNTSTLLSLTARKIPTSAKDDAKLRTIAADETARAEQPTFKAENAKPIGETKTIVDRRFLRKTRAMYQVEELHVVVTFRQVRAGDVVVSLTSVSSENDADALDALADKVALSVRAAR